MSFSIPTNPDGVLDFKFKRKVRNAITKVGGTLDSHDKRYLLKFIAVKNPPPVQPESPLRSALEKVNSLYPFY